MTEAFKSCTPPRARNASATRQAIVDAAARQFQAEGYDRAGVRAIAAEAGIDAALICRYFGSKKQLFAAVLETTTEDPMRVIGGPRASCGERIANAFFDPPSASRRVAMMDLVTRSSASLEAAEMIRRHIDQRFMAPVTEWLGGDAAAREKAWLMSAVLMGIIIKSNIMPAREISRERLATLLQQLIDQA